MSLALLFHCLLLNMFRMLVHPSSGACDLLRIYFMCCIALVRCVFGVRLWFGWGYHTTPVKVSANIHTAILKVWSVLKKRRSWPYVITANVTAIILIINQINTQFLFYNKFIICLYKFRALCAHHQQVKTVLYSICYRHTL